MVFFLLENLFKNLIIFFSKNPKRFPFVLFGVDE